jgi:hypothetical protein
MKKIFAFVFAISTFTACDKLNVEMDENLLLIHAEKRALWNAQSYENYIFTYNSPLYEASWSAYYMDVKIAVSKDIESKILEVHSDDVRNLNDRLIPFMSIQDIFDYIEDVSHTIDWMLHASDPQYRKDIKSLKFTVKYNEQYHYPEDVIFTYFRGGGYDGGLKNFRIKILEFTPTL